MRLACDTFLIVTQEAFYCYPTRYCLLHSPQHSWGIRFFIYIVFDENGNFVKTVTTGYDEEFHYVSPVEDEDTMEHWLRENKLYAHRASSFCDRNRSWYSLPLKEQLKNIGWDFDETGKLIKTQW